jgi:hypothetical protein
MTGGGRGGPLGSHRKAARSADVVNHDRAEGVLLHASLSPSEMLMRLASTHLLPAGPLREAALPVRRARRGALRLTRRGALRLTRRFPPQPEAQQ